MQAVLSGGSNMSDRWALVRSVHENLAADEQVTILGESQVYETPPWGVTEQPDFLNAVIVIDTPESPFELLRRGQALEAAAERDRKEHWGPRTLDVDIIQVRYGKGESVSEDPELLLPHPHAHERAFVLVPWAEVEPEATLRGIPISEHLAQLGEDAAATIRPAGSLSGDTVEG